jgi:UDP-N-acetylmuramoylalanine-D-glutamate ligase
MEVWEEIILDLDNNYSPKILKTDSMENAIKFAYKNTWNGKICLLSSASPSFSLWKSYIHKAEQFKEFMKKYGE